MLDKHLLSDKMSFWETGKPQLHLDGINKWYRYTKVCESTEGSGKVPQKREYLSRALTTLAFALSRMLWLSLKSTKSFQATHRCYSLSLGRSSPFFYLANFCPHSRFQLQYLFLLNQAFIPWPTTIQGKSSLLFSLQASYLSFSALILQEFFAPEVLPRHGRYSINLCWWIN